jgi:nitrogen fixation protein NifU and related proteins
VPPSADQEGGPAGRDGLLTALYQEQILEHYRKPHHKGPLDAPDAEATVANPVCGEAMTVMLRREGDLVSEVAFVGQTCAISQASASMMTELARGKTVGEIVSLAGRLADLLRGDAAAAADPTLGDLRALTGVSRIPIRIPCAILPWRALTGALTPR